MQRMLPPHSRRDRALWNPSSRRQGRLRRRWQLLLVAMFAGGAHAAPLDAAARAEVDALLAQLDASGCSFNRNGTWYPAGDAKPHLLRKLKYLEDRGAVQSTEQFIERAASTSSMSGQPYLVRCGSTAPVQSSTWMLTQLQTLRAAPRTNGAPAPTLPRNSVRSD